MAVHYLLDGFSLLSVCSLLVQRVQDCHKIVKHVFEMTALRNETSNPFLTNIKCPIVKLNSLYIRSLLESLRELDAFVRLEGFGNC